LEQLLGGPGLAWFVARVRGRILAAGGESLTGVVQLSRPSPDQRRAAAGLVGWPVRPGVTVRIDLAEVETILRRGPWPAGLADAVVTLTGPVVDGRAELSRTASAWDRAVGELAPVLVRAGAGSGSVLELWWRDWCATGQLKRLARREARRLEVAPSPEVGAALVREAVAILAVLPVASEPLAVLAQRMTGDAHGLDASRPLGRLVVTLAAAVFVAPGSQVSVRDSWAAAGVVMSNVACTALSLGVPGVGAAPSPMARGVAGATATALEAMRSARVPVTLTLDQVRSGGIAALPPGRVVHVCENPTILEVVAQRWSRVVGGITAEPVMVCTWGQPTTAVIELLEILVSRGAECRYHGDFDWAGLRIAESLRGRVSWQPWRFGAADYVAALQTGRTSLQLSERQVESPWDPELAVVMAEHGRGIEEEALADLLAADLVPER